MRTNRAVKRDPVFTHEGAKASHISLEQQLRRSVMSCLLWEDQFYEDGVAIADRIADLASKVNPIVVGDIAREARHGMHLRHVPLLLAVGLAKRTDLRDPAIISLAIEGVIQRADELGEFLSIYWRNGRTPLDHQVKKGLALAIRKFDEYQLAKYDRDTAIKLRDVLRLVHPKPLDAEQSAMWKRVITGELKTPDTWEVRISEVGQKVAEAAKEFNLSPEQVETQKQEGKRKQFERLLSGGKMGYLAVLRNLRNMAQAGVPEQMIVEAIRARKGARNVLPFRYVSAAREMPQFEAALDQALIASVKDMPKFKGTTAVVVDVSGSMRGGSISAKSKLQRDDVAGILAGIFPGEKVRAFAFANEVAEVPHRLGMAGLDAFKFAASRLGGGTQIGKALTAINKDVDYDRIIVITDEQSWDAIPAPEANGYFINVGGYKNGIGYGNGWTHLDGWSENIFRYMAAAEAIAGDDMAEQRDYEPDEVDI